jgi:hypothetical protein
LTAAFWRVFASTCHMRAAALGDSSCPCGVIGLVLNRDGYESGDYGRIDFSLTTSFYDNQTSKYMVPVFHCIAPAEHKGPPICEASRRGHRGAEPPRSGYRAAPVQAIYQHNAAKEDDLLWGLQGL